MIKYTLPRQYPVVGNPALLARFLEYKFGAWDPEKSPLVSRKRCGLVKFFSGTERRFGLLFANEMIEFVQQHSSLSRADRQKFRSVRAFVFLVTLLVTLDVNVEFARFFRNEPPERNAIRRNRNEGNTMMNRNAMRRNRNKRDNHRRKDKVKNENLIDLTSD